MNTGPGVSPPPAADVASQRRPGRDLTPERLLKILHESDWNKAEAGRRLGVSQDRCLEIHEKMGYTP